MTDEERDRMALETRDNVRFLVKKLFIGNGGPPMDVRLSKLETFKQFTCWVAGSTFVVCVLGLIVKVVHSIIIKGP